MTRLFYISNIAMPGPEANTVNVAKMCNAFAAIGCQVTLAVLPGAPRASLGASVHEHYGLSEDFAVVPLPRIGARPAIAAVFGAAMARHRGADVVYTRSPHAALAACMANTPTILEVHTDLSALSALGRSAFIRTARHPKLRSLVAISDALARHLRELIPGQRNCVVAHDGADQRALPSARRSQGRFAAGFVGRLYRGKGMELIAQLAPLCPWADFHIVGGHAEDAAKVVPVPLADNIIFHGSVPHADVQPLMDSWDVVLAPYQRSVIVADGRTDAAPWMSPLKIFEYMAGAKAMLVSDIPVLREVLTDNDTALLLPPERPDAWAGAIMKLRDEPGLRSRLGARAHEVFLHRHTWTQRARHILQSSIGLTDSLRRIAAAAPAS